MAKKKKIDTQPQVSETQAIETRFEKELLAHLRSGAQVIFIQSSEWRRATREIHRIMRRLDSSAAIAEWDAANGLALLGDSLEIVREIDKTQHPLMLMQVMQESKLPDICPVVAHGFDQVWAAGPSTIAALRSANARHRFVNTRHRRPLIVVSPTKNVPTSLERDVVFVEFGGPTRDQLARVLDGILQPMRDAGRDDILEEATDDVLNRIVDAATGMTVVEAEHAFATALVLCGKVCDDMAGEVMRQAAALIEASGILSYTPAEELRLPETLVGYDNFYPYLQRASLAFGESVKEMDFFVEPLKGLAMVGPPGTGKSVSAEVIAATLRLPLFRMNVGALFGKYVGESEERMRGALATIKRRGACVLLVDEADKLFANAHKASGDSGTTNRVFAEFLTWMAKDNENCVVLFTLNRFDSLPQEMTRSGRIDSIWYTDLPSDEERKAIFKVHLKLRLRNGRTLDDLQFSEEDWVELVDHTKKFTGADIEQAVKDGLTHALAERHKLPTMADMLKGIRGVVPGAERDPDSLTKFRQQFRGARPVSSYACAIPADDGRNVDI